MIICVKELMGIELNILKNIKTSNIRNIYKYNKIFIILLKILSYIKFKEYIFSIY